MAPKAKAFTHMDDTERRLIKDMVKAGIPWSKIQEITTRSSSTISSVLSPDTAAKNPKGAPKKLPPKVMKEVVKKTVALQKQAGARKEITATMITNAAGVQVCDKTLQTGFQTEGFGFYKLKEGPILDKQDMKDRLAWAKRRVSRSKEAWINKPHAIIDNKHFQMFTTEGGREHAARRSVRGAYQKKGQKPEPWLVKPPGGSMKFPARGVTVTAAVIKGKIRMWEYVVGNWNGYKGALVRALRKTFPEHAKKAHATWSVIEDNDPAGYKSSKGKAAKAEVGIATDNLPRRSPGLNVLDYALWAIINRKMRSAEAEFPKGYKETEDEFKARLKKTAMSLPTGLVKKCVGDMRRRCQQLIKVKGGYFKD
jgi:hypothetical protein